MGACARNMYSDSAEIKPAQCCIKLVFNLTCTMMHGSTKFKKKLSFNLIFPDNYASREALLAYSVGTEIFLSGRQTDYEFNVDFHII